MSRGAPLACALLIAGCAAEAPPPSPSENLEMLAERMAGNRTAPPVRPSPEPETPLDDRAAAALAREFGLPRCASNIARLREVRGDGLFAESWRVRGGDACFADWGARQRKYGMLEHLVDGETKADLDRLPWLCGEDGAHVAQCSTQGRRVTLVIENPRFAPFLLFRRISRDVK